MPIFMLYVNVGSSIEAIPQKLFNQNKITPCNRFQTFYLYQKLNIKNNNHKINWLNI